MEKLFLAGWILLIAVTVWIIIDYIRAAIMLKKTPERVRVRRSAAFSVVWLICSCFWIANAGFQISAAKEKLADIDRGVYDDIRRPETQTVEEHRAVLRKSPQHAVSGYRLILAFWIFGGVIYASNLLIFRWAYITPEWIIFQDGVRKAEKYTYQLTETELLLYSRGSSPQRFKILDREPLEQMLKAHYKPHS